MNAKLGRGQRRNRRPIDPVRKAEGFLHRAQNDRLVLASEFGMALLKKARGCGPHCDPYVEWHNHQASR